MDETARRLIQARRTQRAALAASACPPDVQAAYAAQDAVARAFGWFEAGPPRHWKSGGPSRKAVLTHAPLPPDGVWTSSADASTWPFHLRGIEAEIALHLAHDVDPAVAMTLDVSQSAALVDAMCVSIEMVESRWVEALDAPALAKLADLQSHGALVLGPWLAFAPRDWGAQVCRVQIGLQSPVERRGTHALADPAFVLPACASCDTRRPQRTSRHCGHHRYLGWHSPRGKGRSGHGRVPGHWPRVGTVLASLQPLASTEFLKTARKITIKLNNHPSGRHFLQIPGPSPVPDRILRAISLPTIDHRGPEFAVLGKKVIACLQAVFQTQHPVFIYPASGTGAWEAALANVMSPGDNVLMYETGHFATLWQKMALRLGLVPEFLGLPGTDETTGLPLSWRNGVQADLIEQCLRQDGSHRIKAVCVVHNETSTGVTSDVAAMRRAMDAAGHPHS